MKKELVSIVAMLLTLAMAVAFGVSNARTHYEPAAVQAEAGPGQPAAEAPETVEVAAATGMVAGQPVGQYFADTCGGCHGPNREGGTGPALIPGRLTESPDFYATTIKEGRPGTIMPPWSASLSDKDVDVLVNYILSEPSAEAVSWELENIAATREVLVEESALPDAPTHSGNIDNLMLITEREARSIAVVDGDTHTLLDHIDASYRAHGYVFDPTDSRWAYNLGRDGWLFKIDLYSLQAVTRVRVGHDARGLAISDNGQYVIAGNYIPHSAVILDAETLEPLKVITTEGVDPDGNFVGSRVCIVSDVSEELVGPYFIIALKEAGQMWRIDYSDPEFPIDKVENVGRILHDGFLNLDNTRFYIASQTDNWMTVIDVVNWQIVEKIPTGETPHPGSGAVWEANGTSYGATVHAGEGKITVWDLSDNQIVAEIPTTGPGLFIRSTHHSPYVWADAMFAQPANEITVFDGSTFEVVTRITDGTLPLHPEFTADGSAVYVADWEENVVRVYNAESFEPITTIEGIQQPTGIFNSSRRAELLGH